MNLRNVRVIFRKELIDALRDRRTIISTIVVPILLFPLITIGFGAMAAKSVKKVQQEGSTVMLLQATNAPKLAELIRRAEGINVVPARSDYAERISEKKLRAAVEFPRNFESGLNATTGSNPPVRILHYAGEMRSQFAVRALQKVIREYRDQIVEGRLAASGLPKQVLKPFEVKEENVASPQKVGGNILGGLIPYVIIFLCLAGAMPSAIDLTAGEKERGTIETILASPVNRMDLVAGKFLMVLTASLVTAVISLTSFGATFSLPFLAIREMSRVGPNAIPFDLSLTGIVSVFALVIPLAVMFSAVLLALSLYAKSYKEAQSYVSPLMILVILPAMGGLLPGAEMNARLALVPILNVSLVSKDLLTGSFQWPMIALVFGSSCVYAAAALGLAVVAFNRESVLFRA